MNFPQDVIGENYSFFNVYGLEWTPTTITWYLNDQPIRKIDNPGVVDFTRLILNFALNPFNFNSSLNSLPQSMVIEYVKFFDLNRNCSTTINSCTYNFAIHSNTVKKEILLGGAGCVNIVPNNSSFVFRANQGVTIDGDFYVPLGSEVIFTANGCYK